LAKTLKPSQDLDARLSEAEQDLADAVNSIPTDLNSTLVINDILKLAGACQVDAIPLTAGPWTEENINQGYHVFNMTMSLQGSFPQIHTFIEQLETAEYKTIIIASLTVTQAEPVSAAVEATLSLSIYSGTRPPGKEQQ